MEQQTEGRPIHVCKESRYRIVCRLWVNNQILARGIIGLIIEQGISLQLQFIPEMHYTLRIFGIFKY